MAFGLLYDYLNGNCIDAFSYFGAHFISIEKKANTTSTTKAKKENVSGVMFRLYAPMADDVSIIGSWNDWNPFTNKMNKVDDCGVWELFIPNLINYQSYKFHFKNAKGEYVDKADPFAFFSEMR